MPIKRRRRTRTSPRTPSSGVRVHRCPGRGDIRWSGVHLYGVPRIMEVVTVGDTARYAAERGMLDHGKILLTAGDWEAVAWYCDAVWYTADR